MSKSRGRFVVGTIPEHLATFFPGIETGDEIIAPEGFPEEMDGNAPPGARATVEHHRVRTLHPNTAWMLRTSGVLREPTPGT